MKLRWLILIFLGVPASAPAGETYQVVSVKFNLPDTLPKKKWRGSLPNFALVPEFRLTKDGWAKIKFLDRDSRWAELGPNDPVQVELRRDGCNRPLRITIPKESFDGRGRPVNIRPDEVSLVVCRPNGSRECSVEILHAGSREPVEGVSIIDRGLLGKTGADGRWLGTRSESSRTARLIGEKFSGFSFDTGGNLRDAVTFCERGSPEHEIIYVVPASPPNEIDSKRVLVLFRPGMRERRTADGLDVKLELENPVRARAIAPLGSGAVWIEERLLFMDDMEELAGRVRLANVFDIPISLKRGDRDLTNQVKRRLSRGAKRCRLDLLGWAGSKSGPREVFSSLQRHAAGSGTLRAHAFGAPLKLSPSGQLSIPAWLAGLGGRSMLDVRLSDDESKRELGRVKIGNLRLACLGGFSNLSWSSPRKGSAWSVRVVRADAPDAPIESASVYVAPVRSTSDCDPSRRELWAGRTDRDGVVWLSEASDQFIEHEGLCVCAERLGISACNFGFRDSLKEIRLPGETGRHIHRARVNMRLDAPTIGLSPSAPISLCVESSGSAESKYGGWEIAFPLVDEADAISVGAWSSGLFPAWVKSTGLELAKADDQLTLDTRIDLAALAGAWLLSRAGEPGPEDRDIRQHLRLCDAERLSEALDRGQLSWIQSPRPAERIDIARAILAGRLAERNVNAGRAFSDAGKVCPKPSWAAGINPGWGQGALYEMLRALLESSPRASVRLEIKIALLSLLADDILSRGKRDAPASTTFENIAAICAGSERAVSGPPLQRLRECAASAYEESLTLTDPFLMLLSNIVTDLSGASSGGDHARSNNELFELAIKKMWSCANAESAN